MHSLCELVVLVETALASLLLRFTHGEQAEAKDARRDRSFGAAIGQAVFDRDLLLLIDIYLDLIASLNALRWALRSTPQPPPPVCHIGDALVSVNLALQ